MNFDTLTDDEKQQLREAVGCTFDNCDTADDLWLAIEGKPGTPNEGELAVLCETHTKLMTLGEDFPAEKVGYVTVADLGTASLN